MGTMDQRERRMLKEFVECKEGNATPINLSNYGSNWRHIYISGRNEKKKSSMSHIYNKRGI
jgi:hypothetical protein